MSKVVVAALLVALVEVSGQQYRVSTIAGGVPPPSPGTALHASIGDIGGVAIDAAGYFFVSSVDLGCVFKIDPSGTITRVAGTCRPGYSGDGGPAVRAQLDQPSGLAVDQNGTLYITDRGNQVIRKVSKDGTITTVAGGTATTEQLAMPTAVAADGQGNLYIADSSNSRVLRISTDGAARVVAGNGTAGHTGDGRPATQAQLARPSTVTLDSAGNLYIADTSSHNVRKVSSTGMITTIAGTGIAGYAGDGGPAAEAQLSSPYGLAVHEGNLYIADLGNNRVRKVDPGGIITTIAGNGNFDPSGDGGPAIAATVVPLYLASDRGGNLYIAGDTASNTGWGRLRRISQDGIITTIARSGSAYSGDGNAASSAQLSSPAGLALDHAGNLYVNDGGNHRIREITTRGIIKTVAGTGSLGSAGDGGMAKFAEISNYCHLASDPRGNLFIADEFHKVRKTSPKGVITAVAGTGTAGFTGDGGPAASAQLNSPQGMALDSAGNLYIADMLNQRVRKVDASGTISTVAGNGSSGHAGDGGTAVNAQLDNPGDVAVDSIGNLYVLEYQDSRIRRVSPDGMISTAATVPGAYAIAFDVWGALYIAASHSVVKISSNGATETIAGPGKGTDSGDGGPAIDASFNRLWGIAVDHAGRVFVSDIAGNTVRMLEPTPPLRPRSWWRNWLQRL